LELAETGIAFKVITDPSGDLLMSCGKADRVIERGVPHPEGCHPSPAGTAADA
jgi:hypothetical protein